MLLDLISIRDRGPSIPGLANVDNIDPIGTRFPQVWFHVNLQVLGSEMALSCEEHLNVLGSGIEDRGEV